MENPFNPSFGNLPSVLIGRGDILDKISYALNGSVDDPYRIVLFVGARGMGKTVLLESVVESSYNYGFISVNITASKNMVEDLFEQIEARTKHLLNDKKQLKKLSIKHFSLEFFENNKALRLRTRLEGIIEQLNEMGIGLLITLDEVYRTAPGFEELVIAYQHYKRERRNVALMLAGLPKNISDILADTDETRNLTFLRRAMRYNVKELNQNDVIGLYLDAFNESSRKLSKTLAKRMAESTKGYPFLVQLLGYYIWLFSKNTVTTKDFEKGLSEAVKSMNDLVLSSSINDLSGVDKKFLKVMAITDDAIDVKTIREQMGVSQGYVQKYRSRLLSSELVYSPSYGKLDFALPFLREYIRELPSYP